MLRQKGQQLVTLNHLYLLRATANNVSSADSDRCSSVVLKEDVVYECSHSACFLLQLAVERNGHLDPVVVLLPHPG